MSLGRLGTACLISRASRAGLLKCVEQYLGAAGIQTKRIHTSLSLHKGKKPEPSPEPYKFTTSAANIPSMPNAQEKDRNEHQPAIVTVSLVIFMLYFLYLREENDLDEQLNVSLFDRVPAIEEPHLAQVIPKMREKGIDTREAEARLKELVDKRLAKERKEKAEV